MNIDDYKSKRHAFQRVGFVFLGVYFVVIVSFLVYLMTTKLTTANLSSKVDESLNIAIGIGVLIAVTAPIMVYYLLKFSVRCPKCKQILLPYNDRIVIASKCCPKCGGVIISM